MRTLRHTKLKMQIYNFLLKWREVFFRNQRKDSLLFAGKDSMLAGSCVGKLSRRDAANGAVGAEGTIDHGIGPNGHIVAYLDGTVDFSARAYVHIVA